MKPIHTIQIKWLTFLKKVLNVKHLWSFHNSKWCQRVLFIQKKYFLVEVVVGYYPQINFIFYFKYKGSKKQNFTLETKKQNSRGFWESSRLRTKYLLMSISIITCVCFLMSKVMSWNFFPVKWCLYINLVVFSFFQGSFIIL